MNRAITAIPLLLLVLAWTQVLMLNTASAAPSDGVRCPNGYDTRYEAALKTMRCERSTSSQRPTVCDPAASEHVVYRAVKGRDFCVRPADATMASGAATDGDSRRRSVVCSADSADGLRWQIDIDATGERDRCRATQVEWIYPSQQ